MWRRELIIALGFAMAWPIAANGQPDVRALRAQILPMQAECSPTSLRSSLNRIRARRDCVLGMMSGILCSLQDISFHDLS